MMRDDYVIASGFKFLEDSFSEYPIHWPHQESGALDVKWIEPFIEIARLPSKVEYGSVVFEINIFRTEAQETYDIWRCGGILATLLRSRQIKIMNWPDGGAIVVGCIRLFDPVLRPLDHVTAGGGARAGIQQINLRIEGALIGE